MATAAAIAMVPGMELNSIRSVSSGEGSVAGMPFVVSMEAEMAVSSSSQSDQAGRVRQEAATENVPAVEMNGASKLEPALKGKFAAAAMTPEKASLAEEEIVQAGARFKASTGNTKVLTPATSTKVSAVHPEEKESAETADAVPVADQKQTFGIAVSIETVTDVAADVVQPSSAQAEDIKATASNEAEAGKEIAIVSEDVEKAAGLELKDGLTGTVVGPSSNKATKGNGEVTKREKTEKGDKAEEDSVEKEENVTAPAAVSVPVVAQLVMAPTNPTQIKLDKGQESVDLSLPTSVKITAGTKGKLVSLVNSKGSKRADEVKHPDEKAGLETASKLPTEGELRKQESGRKMELIGAAAAGAESSKTHNDRADAHVEGAGAGTTGAVPAVHPGHADAVVSRPEPANLQSALMQHGAAMQSEARSDAFLPGEAAPRMILATPTALEVGVVNGTHGWLKVRAEMTGAGTVNASLATASTSGQEMLHRELPSLTAYLHSEHVAVNTIVVQQASVGADLRGHTSGMMGDGRGQAGQNNGQPSGESRQQAARFQDPIHRIWNEGSEEMMPFTPHASGGGWLSVRA